MKKISFLGKFQTWALFEKGYNEEDIATWTIYGREFARWYKYYLPSACWRNVTANDVENFCKYLESHGYNENHLQIAESALGTIMAYVNHEMERKMRRRRKAA